VDADKSNEHEKASHRYLEKVANAYILDASSGIYKPKAVDAQKEAAAYPKYSDRKRPLWVTIVRDWPVFLVSVGTLVLLIATVYYARKQWCETDRSAGANEASAQHALDTLGEIQAQTKLMREQTIGTQGAILALDPALSFPGIAVAVRSVPGRVAAKNVTVRLTAQRIYIPSKKPIGNAIHCDLNVAQIAGTDPLMTILSAQVRACYLPNFDQKAWDEVMYTRQSVVINGSMSYDNGFGEIFNQSFCRIYLAYKFSGFIAPGRSTAGGDSSFHDCADFDQFLRRALAYKEKYGEAYTQDMQP
jgi:hypothetical protein